MIHTQEQFAKAHDDYLDPPLDDEPDEDEEDEEGEEE